MHQSRERASVTIALGSQCLRLELPEADVHQSRLIAGKIIPAIATTTAVVAGASCIELYKLLQRKPIEAYKCGFINLALPLFTFSEPQPPKMTLAKLPDREWKWSPWDCIDIDQGDMLLSDLLAHVQDTYGCEVTMLSYGVAILFSFFANKKKVKERMPMPMSRVIEAVTGSPVDPQKKFLNFEVICQDDDCEEVCGHCSR